MKKTQFILGLILLAIIIFGGAMLKTSALYFRLVIGTFLGYALTRSFMGFAGSANRSFRAGSTKLMRILMLLFIIASVFTLALFVFKDPTKLKLSIYPINMGLIVGGIMFGIGMSFCSCCASGTLTDLVTALPRGIATFIFFIAGVYVAFPLQKTATWVTKSWFTSEIGAKTRGGVFIPDLFKWDGLDGYLGALIFTSLIALFVVYLSYRYEQRRIKEGTFNAIPIEVKQSQYEPINIKEFKLCSEDSYYRFFVKPWSMQTGAVMIALGIFLILAIGGKGWGVTSAFGIWFGKILVFFGVPIEQVAAYSHRSIESFAKPFFEHSGSVQNLGILLGTLLYILLSSTVKENCTEELKVSFKDIVIFAIGGFIMGFGTRLGNGCNAGALVTPIAQFSLSGWVYLFIVTFGGYIGHNIRKRVL